MGIVRHTASFRITQPVDRLFPLFTPEGEKLWAPGWDYENLMGTTELSEDYVFLTGSHDHASSHAIWLVKRYRPEEGLVEYYRVEPEDKVGVVTVRCRPEHDVGTRVEVTYKYIPLSERGRAFTSSYSQQAHEEFIAGWQAQLEGYFERNG
ncbi:MAG: hypothetical protein PVI04_07565 [Anaerolineales bacterium]|jgi:hypothetical protein